MVLRRVLVGSIIVILFASPMLAKSIALVVKEPSGIERKAWPVTSGVPLPQGALKNPAYAKLLQGSTELPLQTEVLCRWPDGSVRWLLLDFQVDLARREEKTFSLHYGPGVRRAAAKKPVRVTDDSKAVVVNTGPMQLRLCRKAFGLLDAVWLDTNGDGKFSDNERVTGPDGAGIVLKTPDGKTFRADAARADMTIEQTGPLRVCVRVEGKHALADKTMFRYVVRIHAFRGQPFVRFCYTFINDYQDELMARIRSLDLVFSLPRKTNVSCVLDGKSGQAGRLFQVDEQYYKVNGEEARKWAPGWAAVGGNKAGFAVGVREFWQNWPKAIKAGPGVLTVGICPEFAKQLYAGWPLEEENKLYYYLRDGVYTFKVGAARTHELWATFFAGRPDVDKLTEFFQVVEDPLLARCEPAYISSTRALGEFPPADESKYGGYDAWVRRALSAHLRRRDRVREYGMLNYGDWYGERNVNWGNLEYDLAYGLFLQYLRGGDRRFFLRAEQAARHHIDMDVIHAVNEHIGEDPRGGRTRVGDIWCHCLNHTGGYYEDSPLPVSRVYQVGTTRDFGHVWVGGDIIYYYLTGDRRALEVAIEVADAMAANCPTYYYGTHIRDQGWPLLLLVSAYEATGNKKYLNAAGLQWKVLKDNIDWQRGWVVRLARDHCRHPDPYGGADARCHGNVAFMEGLTLCALARYHRITADPEVLKAITVGIDQMIRECWEQDKKAFRYTACPLTGITPHIVLSAEAIAYEVALTGNKEHLRILREGLPAAIPKGDKRDMGKSLGMMIHFTPFGLSAMER